MDLPSRQEWFPAFRVNVTTSGQQQRPAVATDADGRFVVVWMDDADRNGFFDLVARAFNADGTERLASFTATRYPLVSDETQAQPWTRQEIWWWPGKTIRTETTFTRFTPADSPRADLSSSRSSP
jgi:hypothetical protein